MFHPDGPTFWELARQGLSSTVEGYNLLAPKFDYTPFRTPDSLLKTAAKHIGATESIGTGVDLCCGTGAGMAMLRPLCRDRVVGIDFSTGMLDVARRQVESAPGEAELEFIHGDVLDLNINDRFDVAVSFGAFGHILPADQPAFLQNVFFGAMNFHEK